MPSFEQARRLILENVSPLRAESVSLPDAAGRVLAEAILAPVDLPTYDNSAMDGFAVRAADGAASGARLRITGYIPAGGWSEKPLAAGCAIRIMTGAPIPAGCDAVVPVEETEEQRGEVCLRTGVRCGQHVRRRGEDVKSGAQVLEAATVLHPAAIGILASLGRAFVPVYERPRVAILSTGDELVELGDPIGAGKIVNSNSLALAAALGSMGAIPMMLESVRDDRAEMRARLAQGLQMDAVITTAGISAGDRDFVPEVLHEIGVHSVFREVAMKPGGTASFGLREGKPVFSLPGNPVSAMVVFETLVRPAILKMTGHRRVLPVLLRAELQQEVRKKAGKLQWLRVLLRRSGGRWLAWSAGDQSTGIQTTLVRADGLAMLAAEATYFAAGDQIEVHPLWGEGERGRERSAEEPLQ